MSGAYTLFYASMPFVSVSEASACFFGTSFVCLFAAGLLGKNRILAHWAVFMGLIGVLVVIQLALMVLSPSFCPLRRCIYAVAVIITRGFCNERRVFSNDYS